MMKLLIVSALVAVAAAAPGYIGGYGLGELGHGIVAAPAVAVAHAPVAVAHAPVATSYANVNLVSRPYGVAVQPVVRTIAAPIAAPITLGHGYGPIGYGGLGLSHGSLAYGGHY